MAPAFAILVPRLAMLCTWGHFIPRPKFATFSQLELVQKFVSYASKDVPRLAAACKRDTFN